MVSLHSFSPIGLGNSSTIKFDAKALTEKATEFHAPDGRLIATVYENETTGALRVAVNAGATLNELVACLKQYDKNRFENITVADLSGAMRPNAPLPATVYDASTHAVLFSASHHPELKWTSNNTPSQRNSYGGVLVVPDYSKTQTAISNDQILSERIGAHNYDSYKAQKSANDLSAAGFTGFAPYAPLPGETLSAFYDRVAAPLGVSWGRFLEANRLNMRMNFPQEMFKSGSAHEVYERGTAEDT